jgi:hypothetical protein
MANRREFIKNATGLIGMSMLPHYDGLKNSVIPTSPIRITGVDSNFEREPLIRPFGFKGGYMTEIWQTAVRLESDQGNIKIGLCSQSVLWSDARIFAEHAEAGGNALMYAMTE